MWIDIRSLAHQHAYIALAAKHAAQRGRDLARRERPRRDLIEQRLEEMEIPTVDERDLNRRMLQRLRGVESAEAPAENDDALCDSSRIAGGGMKAVLAYTLLA